jgi:hypothetical protein
MPIVGYRQHRLVRMPEAEADANHVVTDPGCPLAFDSGEAHRLADNRVLKPWAIT